MASRINTEFNYKTIVEGETIWYRIKTLKGFLEDRKAAMKNRRAAELKREAIKARLEHDDSLKPWERLELEAQLAEIEAMDEITEDGYIKCEREIETLEKLLKELYEIAEPTRIPGYDDDMMVEATAIHEFSVKLAKEIKANLVSTGVIPPHVVERVMRAPESVKKALVSQGLIPNDLNIVSIPQIAVPVLKKTDHVLINYVPVKNEIDDIVDVNFEEYDSSNKYAGESDG